MTKYLLPVALLVATAVPAHATGKHERVEIKEVKDGMKIKLVIRPDTRGYDHVYIGIGKTGVPRNHQVGGDPKGNYLLYQHGPVVTKGNEPTTVEFTVKLKDIGLKPGDKFEIASAFKQKGQDNTGHLWGMANGTFDVPGKAAKRIGIAKRMKRAPVQRQRRANSSARARQTSARQAKKPTAKRARARTR